MRTKIINVDIVIAKRSFRLLLPTNKVACMLLH